MLNLIDTSRSDAPGQFRQETSTARARRIIAEELTRLGWTAEELSRQQGISY